MSDTAAKKVAVGEFIRKSARLKDARGLECLYVLCPVMIPGKTDTDKDWIAKEDLEMVVWDFSLRYAGVYTEQVEKQIPIKQDAVTGHRHRKMISKSDVAIVENYRLPVDCVIEKAQLPAGTWMQGLLIYSDDIMKEIESGELNGLSVGGSSDLVEEKPPGCLF